MSDAKDLVHPGAEGFKDRITPKAPGQDVFFFKCPKCESIHFRHAGYVKNMMPYLKHGGEKKVSVENLQVMVCVKCKGCYVWLFDQMYDVTDNIDLQAWERLEIEAHRATGPGGDC